MAPDEPIREAVGQDGEVDWFESVGGPVLPAPTAWESLQTHLRWLLEHAESVAARAPEERVRIVHDEDGQEEARYDEHILLNDRLSGLTGLLARCRRETYEGLVQQGWSQVRVAELFGVGSKAVSKVLASGRQQKDAT